MNTACTAWGVRVLGDDNRVNVHARRAMVRPQLVRVHVWPVKRTQGDGLLRPATRRMLLFRPGFPPSFRAARPRDLRARLKQTWTNRLQRRAFAREGEMSWALIRTKTVANDEERTRTVSIGKRAECKTFGNQTANRCLVDAMKVCGPE